MFTGYKRQTWKPHFLVPESRRKLIFKQIIRAIAIDQTAWSMEVEGYQQTLDRVHKFSGSLRGSREARAMAFLELCWFDIQ